MKALAAVGGAVALSVASTVGLGVLLLGGVAPAEADDLTLTGAGTCLPASAAADVPDLTADQEQVARAIVTAGQQLGVSRRGLEVAIATAMQESTLRADPGTNDLDSRGAFQQRDPWGPVADRIDPGRSATLFFTGGRGGQRGLLDVAGWEQMPLWQAAQTVQVSAYPQAYARWEPLAVAAVAAITGGQPAVCQAFTVPAGLGQCGDTGSAAEHRLTPDALLVLRCGAEAFPQITSWGGVGSRPNRSDHGSGRAVDGMIPDWHTPAGNAFGWQVADWYVSNHQLLGITYIIWDDQIASAPTFQWRRYTHPNGPTSNPTLRHLDHLHVSVKGNASWQRAA